MAANNRQKAFIRIDEQGWYFHFRAESPHPVLKRAYWWFGCAMMKVVRRFESVEVVNTYVPDGHGKAVDIKSKD